MRPLTAWEEESKFRAQQTRDERERLSAIVRRMHAEGASTVEMGLRIAKRKETVRRMLREMGLAVNLSSPLTDKRPR